MPRRVVFRGNQPAQSAFLTDRAPGATLYQGGFGSGKTAAACRKFLWFHARNARSRGLLVAPTLGDIYRFMVPALVGALGDLAWPYEIVRSGPVPKMVILGRDVYIISGEHPSRFAGFEVGHAWIDEGARIKQSREDPLNDAPTQIRGRLRCKLAERLHLMVSTTPEGTDTWVQRDWFDRPQEAHRAYTGSTLLNQALPTSYLDSLKATLPAELVAQYLHGQAVNYVANRAHPTFSRATHVRDVPWQPHATVHIGADFNTSPLCWTAGQRVGDAYHVLDEVVIDDYAQVDQAVRACHDRGWATGRSVVLHPDKSAKNRSTTGDPEITVMLQTARALGWSVTGDAYGVNPPVNGRLNLLSRMLLDAAGVSRLVIHPRCTRLIEDLERTARASSGYDPGPEGKRGHILDGLGYALWDLFQPATPASVSTLL